MLTVNEQVSPKKHLTILSIFNILNCWKDFEIDVIER